MSSQTIRARERVPTGRRGRPSKSMIAAALERPFCAYLHKICLNNRLEGHKYCIDHIMNDKTAPYRQCTFVHPVTGRRCSRAAHKVDRRASPLCFYHRAQKANQLPPPNLSPEELASSPSDPRSLLEDLAHHQVPLGPDRPQSTNTFWIAKEDGSAVPSAKLCKAFIRYNYERQKDDPTNLMELPTMEEIAARHNNADSDTESVDNQMDLFKNGSVFTEEELTRTLRDKNIKLRRLYIEQYGHIQYILKEKRLKYIQAQRMEDELYGEGFSFRNFRESPEYAKLRAMLRYHKTFGPESLLQEQAKRKKSNRPPPVGPHTRPATQAVINEKPATNDESQSEGDKKVKQEPQQSHTHSNYPQQPPQPPHHHQQQMQQPSLAEQNMLLTCGSPVQANTCIFSRTAHGCDKPCVPLSPYCKNHILFDTKQVLFRPCAGGMPPCLTPVVSFMRKNKCWLHTAIN